MPEKNSPIAEVNIKCTFGNEIRIWSGLLSTLKNLFLEYIYNTSVLTEKIQKKVLHRSVFNIHEVPMFTHKISI